MLLFIANPRCVRAQDILIDAIVPNVLFRDDTPRDLRVVSPGKSHRVRIPIINTLGQDLFLAESSSSCLCTSVVPLKKLFSPNSENHVEMVVKAGNGEGIEHVTVNLKFRGTEEGNESMCDTGNANVTNKCYIKEEVDVDGEPRQVARVQFELNGIPSGEGFNEKIELLLFAHPFGKKAALVEVGTFTVDVIRPKRIEVTPRVLHLNQSEDLAFIVISKDESFSIADKDLELIVQPTGAHINANVKKISPRWVRVVVKASEFCDFVGNSEKLQRVRSIECALFRCNS